MRPVATQLDAIEQGLDKLLQSHTALEKKLDEFREEFNMQAGFEDNREKNMMKQLDALEQEVRTEMNMFRYAHMCRDGHQQIGHNDSEHEMCPLCRALALCKIEQRAKKPAKRAKKKA